MPAGLQFSFRHRLNRTQSRTTSSYALVKQHLIYESTIEESDCGRFTNQHELLLLFENWPIRIMGYLPKL